MYSPRIPQDQAEEIMAAAAKAHPIFPQLFPTPSVKPTNPKDVIGIRKGPMSTVPANVLAELGAAMLEGACKYGRHNYRAVGVRASVYYDGTLRHIMDWWEGEDIDPDSGLNHVIKAIASLTVLRDSMLQGNWTDDRPPRPKRYRLEINQRAADLLDKYADKLQPLHYTALNIKAVAAWP